MSYFMPLSFVRKKISSYARALRTKTNYPLPRIVVLHNKRCRTYLNLKSRHRSWAKKGLPKQHEFKPTELALCLSVKSDKVTSTLSANPSLFEKRTNSFARLCTFLNPCHSLICIHLKTILFHHRIICSQNFEKPTVSRHSGICCHNSVKGFLFCSSSS
jgi:hypothetical protein